MTLGFKENRNGLGLVLSTSKIGLIFVSMIFLQSVFSSYVRTLPLLLASNAVREFDNVEGKPSVEELRLMKFHDSLRIDSLEKSRFAKRKRNQLAIAIKADESECLASTINNKTCLVTVGAVNRRISSSTGKTNISDSFRNSPDSIASMRRSFLNKELADSFASLLFDKKIANPYIEEVELEWKKELSQKEEKIGKKKLHAIYQDYLSTLDQTRARYAFVIGSSDSAVLDSLISRSLDSIGGSPRRNHSPDLPEETIPIWSRVEFELLPAELSKLLDTLPSDVRSPIQRTKIGWFSCAIRRPVQSSVSYSDALPLLIEIAFRGGSMKNILLNYGLQNDLPNVDSQRGRSDSIPINVWLAPNEKFQSGRLVTGLKAIDTSAFKPTAAHFSDLPRAMQTEIRRVAMGRQGIVFSNPMGRWFIQFAAPLPRSSRAVSNSTGANEQDRFAAALDSFVRDINSKNHEKKLAMYQALSGNVDISFVSTLKETWIKNQVQINRDLIDQRP